MKLITFILLIQAILGCQTVGKLIGVEPAQPTIRVQDIKLDQLSKDSVSLTIHLRVANPNFYGAKISNLKYDLLLQDQIVAEGAQYQPINIPGEESVLIELPLKVFSDRAFLVFKAILSGSNLPPTKYRVNGIVSTFFGEIDLNRESTWQP
jgi:LEA14-like dessication related protein